MEKIRKKLLAIICICSILVSFPLVRVAAGETQELTTVTLGQMGIADGTYSYNNGDLTASGQYNGSLLNTKWTHKITFSNHAGNWINYAGTPNGWYGIRFNTMADGKIQIAPADGEFPETYYIDPTAAGATLLGEEITLTVELIESGEDVKLGVSINGVLYNNEYFLLEGAASKLGNCVGLYSADPSGYIQIKEEEQSGGDDPIEEIPELTKITFANLGIADGTYSYIDGNLTAVGQYEGSLLNTSLTHKITFSNHASNWLHYAGTADGGGWYGIRFNTLANGQIQIASSNGEFKEDYRIDPTAAGATLLGEEITLTIDLIESGEDVKLGVSINGVLYNNEYFLLEGAASKLGNCVGLYSGDVSGYIRIEEEKQSDEDNPIEEIPELTKITFANLGIADETYNSNGNLTVIGKYAGSLLNTSLTHKVTFSDHAGNWINYAGAGTADIEGWCGIRFNTMADGKIQIAPGNGEFPETYYIDPTAAGATLLGEEITLTIDLIESGEDVKLGVSINGVLYNNEYFLLEGAASKLGSFVGLYSQDAAGYIRIGEEKQPDEDDPITDDPMEEIPELNEITFSNMGIAQGKYAYANGQLSATGSWEGSLLNTSLTQKITFSNHPGNWLNYAGTPDGWFGIRFNTMADGKIQIAPANGEFPEVYYMDPTAAGTALLGKEITLKIDLIQSNQDVKLGVSINGVLYNNEYFLLTGAAEKLGNNIGLYVQEKEGFITIGTQEAAPVLDGSFKQLNFASYDIESGSYGYNNNDLAVSGNCGLNSLDKVVFSDTLQFSDTNGAQLRIGGKKDPWYGMIWEATGDGKLYVTDPEDGFAPMTFDPEKAGVKLTGSKVQLTLSFEYVDSDEDGSRDDVKLGVWFDGKAYDDRYIYLRDYAGKLGGYLGIYSTNSDSALTIWTTFPPIDFTEFGFTERWAYTLRLK